jgi:hypothetical protein
VDQPKTRPAHMKEKRIEGRSVYAEVLELKISVFE